VCRKWCCNGRCGAFRQKDRQNLAIWVGKGSLYGMEAVKQGSIAFAAWLGEEMAAVFAGRL
jgi:hypothetical protein